MDTIPKWGAVAPKAPLAMDFVLAGGAKLAGAPDMVAVFDAIGWGRWFRYATGIVEIGGAALMWVPGLQLAGAGPLLSTMVCAVLFHVFALRPGAVPAALLAALPALVAWHQARRGGATPSDGG